MANEFHIRSRLFYPAPQSGRHLCQGSGLARSRPWSEEVIILRWEDAGFPSEGFVLGAFYWQPGWTDSTKITIGLIRLFQTRNPNMLRYCGYEAQLDGARHPDLLSEAGANEP